MTDAPTAEASGDDLTRLRGLIAERGGLAEVATGEAMEALVRGNLELAQGVVARDKRIDALEMEQETRQQSVRDALAKLARTP